MQHLHFIFKLQNCVTYHKYVIQSDQYLILNHKYTIKNKNLTKLNINKNNNDKI